VDQPALLRQVFGAAISLPAQIVSLQKIQGQLQGKGTLPTIQHYLKLLSDAFLVSGVEKYSRSLLRVRKSSPKLIIHDNGLIRSFEKPIDGKLTPEKLGRYFENCIGARFIEAGWDTYYWKERDLEVDFAVLGPNGEKWAVEIKSSKTNEKELKGLYKFCELNKEFEPVLISLIEQKIEGIKSISAEEILSFSRKY
jgi:predicted AAA+ superfamily ATPase